MIQKIKTLTQRGGFQKLMLTSILFFLLCAPSMAQFHPWKPGHHPWNDSAFLKIHNHLDSVFASKDTSHLPPPPPGWHHKNDTIKLPHPPPFWHGHKDTLPWGPPPFGHHKNDTIKFPHPPPFGHPGGKDTLPPPFGHGNDTLPPPPFGDGKDSLHHPPPPPFGHGGDTIPNVDSLGGPPPPPHPGGKHRIGIDTNDGSLVNDNSAASIIIYPNPVVGNAVIQISNTSSGNVTFRMFESTCKLILSKTNLTNGSFDFNRNNLSAGLYFYNVTDGNSKVTTGKLIIQ